MRKSKVQGRHRMVVRSWTILVMLRQRARTLADMATELGVSERTIRRDLEALCQVPFPIITTRDDIEHREKHATWSLAAIPEWPARSSTPVRALEVELDSGGYARVL